jgi:putative oxidoreductase
MKTLFNKSLQLGNTDFAVLFIRVSIASLMLTHGLPKLANLLSGEPVVFASVFGMSQTLSLSLAVFAEVFCSILILIGLGTRFAAIPLIITMAIAAFYIHAADPFSTKEMAVLYLLGFFFVLIVGGGKYSLDNIIAKQYLNPAKA